MFEVQVAGLEEGGSHTRAADGGGYSTDRSALTCVDGADCCHDTRRRCDIWGLDSLEALPYVFVCVCDTCAAQLTYTGHASRHAASSSTEQQAAARSSMPAVPARKCRSRALYGGLTVVTLVAGPDDD